MYVTILPIILGGILNMLFTKTKFYEQNKSPIDGGKKWKNNRRILGPNKTWIGFFGMILFCAFSQVIWGKLLQLWKIEEHWQSYPEIN